MIELATLRDILMRAADAALAEIRASGAWDRTAPTEADWDRFEFQHGRLASQSLMCVTYKNLGRCVVENWALIRSRAEVAALVTALHESPRPLHIGSSTSPLVPRTREQLSQSAIILCLSEVRMDGRLDEELMDDCAAQMLPLCNHGVPDRRALSPVFNLDTASDEIQLSPQALIRRRSLRDERRFAGAGSRSPIAFGNDAIHATHALVLNWQDAEPEQVSTHRAMELVMQTTVALRSMRRSSVALGPTEVSLSTPDLGGDRLVLGPPFSLPPVSPRVAARPLVLSAEDERELRSAFERVHAGWSSANLSLRWFGKGVHDAVPEDRFLALMIGLESLLIGDGSGEKSFRFATHLAWLVGSDSTERQALFRQARNLYDLRSDLVHTGGLRGKKIGTGETLGTHADRAEDLFREVLRRWPTPAPDWNKLVFG